jgi:hypothetical protein
MGEIITIYHTDIELPDVPDVSEIENWGTDDPAEQYWRRKPLPPIFKNLNYDTEGNIVLNQGQRQYCLRELDKIRNGCWVMINGKPTWLPYNYYYYLQYWTLENKKAPEYRDVSRSYALYRWHWKKSYWCLGILRGKGRRTGATSEITSNITCEVTTNKNRRGGVISKTGKDARKIFLYRVQFGFRHLPFFLQPTLENDKDSKTELVFNVPIKKSKKGNQVSLIDEVEGINSMIDYQAPGLNTYDQERLTDLLLDEGGKMESDIPFSEFLSIISECLVEGGEKVGFAEMPSTVNKWSKGGEQFKIAWDGATWIDRRGEDDDDDIEEDEATANRFVRYYCPAYDGLPGFIGKFGESIIEQPTESQSEYLIKKHGETKYSGVYRHGAKAFLERRRSKLTGAALEEEIRKYSFNEAEMFMSASEGCIFNLFNINKREEELKENPVFKRDLLFERGLDQNVRWRDARVSDGDFHWKITQLLPQEQANKFTLEGRLHKPSRTHIGAIAVDGYGNNQGGRKYGSKASAWIGLKADILNPDSTFKAIGNLYGRPQEKSKLHEQVMLAAEYYGFQAWFEHNSDEYDTYFKDRGKRLYLGLYPLSTISPDKREKTERHRGFPTTPFSLTRQNDVAIAYFENYCYKIDWPELLDNAKKYDPYNRTAFDMVVSFEMLIVCLLEPVYKPAGKKIPLVRVYETQMAGSEN